MCAVVGELLQAFTDVKKQTNNSTDCWTEKSPKQKRRSSDASENTVFSNKAGVTPHFINALFPNWTC